MTVFNASGRGIFPEVFTHEYTHALDYNNPQNPISPPFPTGLRKSGLTRPMYNWLGSQQLVKFINEKGNKFKGVPTGYSPISVLSCAPTGLK